MNDGGSVAIILSFARHGEDEAIRQAVDRVRADSPGVHLAALGTPVSAPVLRKLGIEDVMVLGGERATRGVLLEAKARRPRVAAVVYSGPGTGGHLKLEALALSLPVRRIYRVVPGETVREASRPRLALAVIGKFAQTGVCLAVAGLACGVAWVWLGIAQLLTGDCRARRS
jgi:hypothetical protein